MSLLMTNDEIITIDSKVEQLLDWAKDRRAEAEQLTFDSTRLLSCTSDRLDRLSNQGFFRRCWSRFTGETDSIAQANISDLIQTQKIALRFINMISEQQILMAHSMISLKNNLLTLAIKEEETRNIVALLAQRTFERFEQLERRVDQLEVSTNLQGWLLGLEERDYIEKIPTDNMRLFQIINDFYLIKNDLWNYNDLLFLRKAIRIVNLDPKRKISINTFIEQLVDEIYKQENGFNRFNLLTNHHKPQAIQNFSLFSVNEISSPVFLTIHGLNNQYTDRLDVVETLSDQMSIPLEEALKILLRKNIKDLNVNLDYEFSLAETAIEILGCLRLATLLSTSLNEHTDKEDIKTDNILQSDDDSQPRPSEECEFSGRKFSSNTAISDISKIIRVDWQSISKVPFKPSNIKKICSNGNTWMVKIDRKGDEGYGYKYYRSEDTKKWSFVDKPYSLDSNNFDIDCINNTWILKHENYFQVFFSADATDWEELKGLEVPKETRVKSIYFFDKHWYIAFNIYTTYTYTEKGTFWDSTEESDYRKPIFFRSKSLDGPWKPWQDLSSYLVEGLELEAVASKDNIALYGFEYDWSYASRKNRSREDRRIFCVKPQKKPLRVTWPETPDSSGLGKFLFVGTMPICLNHDVIFTSVDGYKWETKKIATGLDKIIVVDNYLFGLGPSWRADKIMWFASNNGEMDFKELSMPDSTSHRWSKFATNGKEILAVTKLSDDESILQKGSLVLAE